jgi:hypothetical protein
MNSTTIPESGTVAQWVDAEKIEFQFVKNSVICFFLKLCVKHVFFTGNPSLKLIFHADPEFAISFTIPSLEDIDFLTSMPK